ncbi:ABC transporter substrate-binding protein [Paenibacillus hemerocallicola]|nr:extracellular solute-binding protein [Paenibacillus hemerocallicola]
MDRYGKQIQKKYPNYEFEIVESVGSNVQNLVLEQRKVDIIISSLNNYRSNLMPLYGGDLSDLVAKHKFDVNRLESSFMETVRNLDSMKLSALTLYDLRLTLFYNKDIFDKFGVPYPKNHMTWDSLYDVAAKLTRNDGGVQYRGFVAGPSALTLVNQLSLPYTDAKGEKAVLQTDQWKQYIGTLLPLYTVPGYNAKKELISRDSRASFVKEKTTGMFVLYNSDAPKPEENVNWDAVSLPEMKSLPGVGSQPFSVVITVASTSQHRDESFKSIAHLLSDEVQTEIGADFAQITPLKSQTVKDAFGRNVAQWNGKNISSITALKPASPARVGEFDGNVGSSLQNAILSIIYGEKDMNTALRQAEEEATKKIAEAIQMKK